MLSIDDDGRTRLELCVRSLSPSGARSRQDAVLSRLSEFAERGTIADYDVRVWGTGIRPASPTARTEPGRAVLNRLSAFEDWAQRNEVSLDDAFRTSQADSTITGERHVERSFPVLTLAEFAGSDLRCVAPCWDADTAYSVEDCLDAIENGRTLTEEGRSTPVPVGEEYREATDASPDRDAGRSERSNPSAAPSPAGE
ncbi:hypothetical protein BRC68_13710 [Halobacteriales archaeon QH_6_64_20]|nr:MAG: hypothetical protein BRC68_13710 [Halobacteriales archaeon QH_6_64_20]